jgi:DNA-binding Xre family transcriptional regulator
MIVCKLKQILERKGLTRYQLQQRTKITYPTLHSLYHGRSKGYSADVLNRICGALDCKLGELLVFKRDRFPRTKKKQK